MIMYQFSHPYGFINIKVIKFIAKDREYYYIVDDCNNYLITDKDTYETLQNIGVEETLIRRSR